MSRRRYATPPKLFDAAYARIDALELAVVYSKVECRFTLMDVARAFWPDDTVDKLIAAYPCISDRNRMAWHGTGIIPISNTADAGVQCRFYMSVGAIQMLCPVAQDLCWHEARFAPILKALSETHAVHREFEKVRTVVRWLNEYATAGAARYYFPVLCSLLPPGHVLHATTGERYREPAARMTDIVPLMREASATVAGALLCAPLPDQRRDSFTAAFAGTRRTGDVAIASSDYLSQTFDLV
jgi:hypothetical protein